MTPRTLFQTIYGECWALVYKAEREGNHARRSAEIVAELLAQGERLAPAEREAIRGFVSLLETYAACVATTTAGARQLVDFMEEEMDRARGRSAVVMGEASP